MERIWRSGLVGAMAWASLGCEKEAKPESGKQPASAVSQAKPGADGALPARVAEPKRVKEQEEGRHRAGCPAGKWRYDYSDAALETLAGNLEGAQVTKEEGALIVTIASGKSGMITFESEGGKPVVSEISANASGMSMVVHLTMNGKATSKFQISDPGKMLISETDMSGFTIKGSTTIGGRRIELDAAKTSFLFDAQGKSVEHSFECDGENLKLLQRTEGVKTSWLTLKPAK